MILDVKAYDDNIGAQRVVPGATTFVGTYRPILKPQNHLN